MIVTYIEESKRELSIRTGKSFICVLGSCSDLKL